MAGTKNDEKSCAVQTKKALLWKLWLVETFNDFLFSAEKRKHI